MLTVEPLAEVPLEALLNSIIDEFDTKSEAFSEVEVLDKMQFVLGQRALSKEEGALYYGESNAFLFRAPISEGDPFPSYFQPFFGLPKADGTMSWTPDPGELTPEMIARWKKHLELCKHPTLTARYADLLWNFQKQVVGTVASVSVARIAIDAYIEATRRTGAMEMIQVGWLGRAVGLSASIKDSTRLSAAVQRVFEWIRTNAKPNFPGTWTFLFDDLYCNNRVQETDKLQVIAYLKSVLAATIDEKMQTFDHLSATAVSELLAKHYRRRDDKTAEQRVMRAAGLAVEHAASLVTPLLALGWLQPLMQRYRDAGMIADAERVQIESRRRGADARDDMRAREYAVQIPKEAVEKYLGWLREPEEITQRIRRWAMINVNDVDNAQRTLIESLTSTPLLARIGVQPIDAGQVVAKAGSVEDDMDGRLAFHLRQLIQMRLNVFVGGWQELVGDGSIDCDVLMTIFEDSPAFDEEGLELIDAGLVRLFQEDHLSATHILIPQVERALRTTLRLLGRPSNKIVRGEKGVVQELNINDALADHAMKKLLPKNCHRHLQIVFSSRLGFNLRNLIAHGILPASQFSLATSLLALQGLLLLSQIEVKSE